MLLSTLHAQDGLAARSVCSPVSAVLTPKSPVLGAATPKTQPPLSAGLETDGKNKNFVPRYENSSVMLDSTRIVLRMLPLAKVS